MLLFSAPLYAVSLPTHAHNCDTSKSFSISDLIGDGFLWAVPKHRVSIEKRTKKRFGHSLYPEAARGLKLKTTLRSCMQCGSDHEVGVLCREYQKLNMLLSIESQTQHII